MEKEKEKNKGIKVLEFTAEELKKDLEKFEKLANAWKADQWIRVSYPGKVFPWRCLKYYNFIELITTVDALNDLDGWIEICEEIEDEDQEDEDQEFENIGNNLKA